VAIGLPLAEFTAFLDELPTDPRPDGVAGSVTTDRVCAVTVAFVSMTPLKPSHGDGVSRTMGPGLFTTLLLQLHPGHRDGCVCPVGYRIRRMRSRHLLDIRSDRIILGNGLHA
jgi:hypothetical protein